MMPLGTRLGQRLFLRVARARRGMTLGVRAAVFRGEDVLLVRHSYLPGWYFPGGGVAPGETLATALARELVEETRVILEGSPTLFGVYLNRTISRRDHVALYLCPAWRHDDSLPLSGEITEYGFFPPEALPEGTTAATRQRLAEIAGAPATGDW